MSLQSLPSSAWIESCWEKEELIARVFVAAENELPVMQTAEEVQGEIAMANQATLNVEKECLPDPFGIAEGWLPDDPSMTFWPMTLYPDVFNFLSFHPYELKSSELSDYKTSKAYSYDVNGWLNPLFYHPISDSSKSCLLKKPCKPSQRISDVPQKLWICLSKMDDKILRAHCTCIIGIFENFII